MRPPRFNRNALWASALLFVLLAGYWTVLTTYFVPVTGGTDQNGYHVGSWMLVDQGRFSQQPADDFEFVGHMWVVNDAGFYYPKYPPLYPLLAAAAIRLSGHPDAGFWLSPICALLTVAGVYALARVFFPRSWALLAALLMAGTPVFMFYGLNKASHAPSMAFLAWGMAAFFAGASRRKVIAACLLAAAGGFLIGYAVGIRYTNFLLLFPPLLYALLYMRGRRLWIPLAYCAGAAVPGLFLALFHQQAFGAPWRTGYALTQEQTGFSFAWFLPNLRLYATGILDHGTGPVTLFSVLGLLWLFCRRPKRAGVFCSWIFPLFVLYTCYYWAPTTSFAGYLRFVMPILVPLILLALLGLKEGLRPFTRRQKAAAVVAVMLVQSVWGMYQGLVQAEQRWMRDLQALKMVEFAEQTIPEGSVIFADSGMLNHLDFGKRWHLYSTLIFEPHQLKRIMERSERAEVNPLQRERVEKWNALLVEVPRPEYNQRIQALIQGHLDQGRRVYFYGPEKRINNYRNRFRRMLELSDAGSLKETVPAYQWINPAKSSMRNLEEEKEKTLPAQALLEVVAVRERFANARVYREDLIQERQEKMQQLFEISPETKVLFQRIEQLRVQISKIRLPAE